MSRNFIKIMCLATILLLSLTSLAGNNKSVTVELKFNGADEDITAVVDFEKGLSALEALLYVTDVRTHTAGGHVFVAQIKEAKNVKSQKAWYYTINNEFAKELAIKQKLKAGDVVTWIYKQDVCSKTVDGKTGATPKM